MPFLLGSEEHTSELQSPCNLVCRFCLDRKSTRLNSSHLVISYAVFCLKKKKRCATSSRLRNSLSTAPNMLPRTSSSGGLVQGLHGVRLHPGCVVIGAVFVFFFITDGAHRDFPLFPHPGPSPD